MSASNAKGNSAPIMVNTLTSDITHHGDMTLVNTPSGVIMSWPAATNMDVAETAKYMGVNNLQHRVETNHTTGETSSYATTTLTHEEYEAYRRSPHGRQLELPPQPAEKPGNTIGKITFMPPPSGKRAQYANPPEPPPKESNKPNAQLQALIDKANDNRSLWQKTKDGAASAWDSTKRIANASWENPGEFGIGVAKGIGNLPSDVANLAVEGIKNQTGLNNYATFLDHHAMSAYEAGNIASANDMASKARSIREFGSVGDIFEIKNDAQKGGSIASIFVPLGTIVKAGAGASKIAKGAKAVDAAADTAKATDVATDTAKATKQADAAADATKTSNTGDVVKAPEPKGPNGNGGKIKAAKMKQHKPKCFKPGKALRKRYKNDPKKLEKEFYKQLKAQEDGINNMTVGEYTANRKILNDLTAQHGHKKAREILTNGGAAQQHARDDLESKINISIKKSLRARNIKGEEANAIAAKQTQKQMSQLAALHDPDLIAGGYDSHTKEDFKISRSGNKNVNSSLGSQWAKDGRVDGMDKAAKGAMADAGPDTPMNVKLERCKE